MIAIPIAFGLFSILAGLLLLIRPDLITKFLDSSKNRPFLQISAVIGRAVLGAALVLTAAVSKFPGVLLWLGWLVLVAAIVLALIGRARFVRLMSWAQKIAERFGRIGGVIAAMFGAFLVYAYV